MPLTLRQGQDKPFAKVRKNPSINSEQTLLGREPDEEIDKALKREFE
jgi:hypothetical protein